MMSGAGCQEKKVWVGRDEYPVVGHIKVCSANFLLSVMINI